MQAIRLKTEYRENPMGIDRRDPRFTWNCEGGEKQSAYQVVVTDDKENVLFDSGKVKSRSMHCRYKGVPLCSRQRAYWKVWIWDEKGQKTVSDTAWFEMGFLEADDWSATWIAGVDTDKKERLAADCFQRKFKAEKNVIRARLYASACGVYAVWINGKRVKGVLAPGCTEYEKRLYYQVYDVTDAIKKENCIEAMVGDGWYKGKIGSSNTQYFFGTQTAFLCQLEIFFEDGTKEYIVTDSDFMWSNDGPIRYNDLKDGEIYDARYTPKYEKHAVCVKKNVHLEASPIEMIEEHEVFKPELRISPSGAKILDFHQNLAGYIRFAARGKAGQKIRLRMCEALDHGEYSDRTLLHSLPDLPPTKQEIIYICDGEERLFQPEFFYSGFQYALVEGLDSVNAEDFEAVSIYSTIDYEGEFRCSNKLINQFLENTRWSQKSNFVDIPTDCPQREKSGWTGDAQVFAETATYLADTAAFYRKWLRDVRDCQREDGRVDNVCPKIRGIEDRDVLNGAVGWADAAVIIPYVLWKRYGDEEFIRENYDLMHGWKEYVIKAAGDKSFYHLPEDHELKKMIAPFLLPNSEYNQYIIESGLQWGEWHEPDCDPATELIYPKPEITSAYMHYSMSILAEMLRVIGKNDEAIQCDTYAEGAKRAYNHHFVENGKIKAPRQAPMVRALALGLLDTEDQKAVASQLNSDVIARNYKVGTGFLSTPFVLDTLVKYGYVDSAYKMLENTEAPGWLAMVVQGGTTVWEKYISYDEEQHPQICSMNHYSPGAVSAFLFRTVCGIRVEAENYFEIAPVPGGSLTYAEAVCQSQYGKVESGWKREKNRYIFKISIPGNTSAKICLPDGQSYEVGYGVHEFEMLRTEKLESEE